MNKTIRGFVFSTIIRKDGGLWVTTDLELSKIFENIGNRVNNYWQSKDNFKDYWIPY